MFLIKVSKQRFISEFKILKTFFYKSKVVFYKIKDKVIWKKYFYIKPPAFSQKKTLV